MRVALTLVLVVAAFAVLTRLPRGRVTVTIRVRTAAKHTYRASRAYKSCAKAR